MIADRSDGKRIRDIGAPTESLFEGFSQNSSTSQQMD